MVPKTVPTENDGRELFESELTLFFWQVAKTVLRHPALLVHYAGAIIHQHTALVRRKKYFRSGLSVPPVIIFSITGKCNLTCSGCYARASAGSKAVAEITPERFSAIIGEADRLGTRIVFLAGGEPLLRKDLIHLAATHKKTEFLLFTNGTLLDDSMVRFLHGHRNIFPVFSVEGGGAATDSRRGDGVFARFEAASTLLKRYHMQFGLSITVTTDNVDMVSSDSFVASMVQKGCRFFIYVSYIPVAAGTAALVLTSEQTKLLDGALARFRKKFGVLFVSFPGDEERFGGCLSAGRGFIHINAAGGVEPCPFAPFSDVSIKGATLEEALRSDLLKTIRDNRDKIEEHGGTCALFEHRDWLTSITASSPATGCGGNHNVVSPQVMERP